MEVRLKQNISGDNGFYLKGHRYKVSDKEGKFLIKEGYAMEYKTKEGFTKPKKTKKDDSKSNKRVHRQKRSKKDTK